MIGGADRAKGTSIGRLLPTSDPMLCRQCRRRVLLMAEAISRRERPPPYYCHLGRGRRLRSNAAGVAPVAHYRFRLP